MKFRILIFLFPAFYLSAFHAYSQNNEQQKQPFINDYRNELNE
jgi:hypothetical protein